MPNPIIDRRPDSALAQELDAEGAMCICQTEVLTGRVVRVLRQYSVGYCFVSPHQDPSPRKLAVFSRTVEALQFYDRHQLDGRRYFLRLQPLSRVRMLLKQAAEEMQGRDIVKYAVDPSEVAER